MLRANPYEAAFERYLRQQRSPYVAVDESRRALLADVSLKSMDFIVYAAGSSNLLVDVKGRKRSPGRNWENWATVEDIQSLTQWEAVFGAAFRSLLVFAYPVDREIPEDAHDSMVLHQSSRYAFYGVWLEEYRRQMQQRSTRWQTVWLPAEPFRQCRFPLGTLFSRPPELLTAEQASTA